MVLSLGKSFMIVLFISQKHMEEIRCSVSKTKTILMLLLCLLFVVLGGVYIVWPNEFVSTLFRNPRQIFVVGIVSILFFGLAISLFVIHLFNPDKGLIINSEGIVDHLTTTSVGMIYWKDIKEIRKYKIVNQNIILIFVKNPKDYIDRYTHSFIKKNCGE